MKRYVHYILWGMLGLAILLVLILLWLFWTPSGGRTVLKAINRLTPVQIEVQALEGRLADRLTLDGVTLQWPRGEAKIDSLELLWHPGALWGGQLDIERLALDGTSIRMEPSEEPEPKPKGEPDLSFPEVGGFAERVEARVQELKISDLRVHRPEADPLTIERLEGAVAWEEGALKAEDLQFEGSPGRLAGEAVIDFAAPSLFADVEVHPADAPEAYRDLAIEVDLESAGERHLSGPVQISTLSEEGLSLQALVDWGPDVLALEDLRLKRQVGKGEVTGEALVRAEEQWTFELDLRLSDLDLSTEVGTPTDLSGSLVAKGTTEDFQGEFSLANRVQGWQGGRLESPFYGNSDGIRLRDLEGEWLQGKLAGQIAAGWAEGWSVQADLVGEDLNPAEVTPEWPGRINFDLNVAASGGTETSPSAEIDLQLRQSRLRGQPLTGSLEAQLQEEDLHVARLDLQGEGFMASAAGQLSERLDFKAEIARLGSLIPEARGTLEASGWGRWRDGVLSGLLEARGQNLKVEGVQAQAVELTARRPEDDSPFTVVAQVSGGQFDEYRLVSASLQAEGTVAKHRIVARASGPDIQLEMDARGGYGQKQWRGRLQSLQTGGELLGRWVLVDPVPLALSAEKITTGSLLLRGEGAEVFEARADLQRAPLRGFIQGKWNQLNLRRANPWLPEMELAGRTSGNGRWEWLKEDRLDLRGSIEIQGTVTQQGRRVNLRKVAGQIDWGPQGLQAQVDADLAALGKAWGEISSEEPARLSLPEQAVVAAYWQLDELTPLSTWIPAVELSGSSRGDLNGHWEGEKVQFAGEAAMSGGVVWQDLKLQIRQLEAVLHWDEEGLMGQWSIDLAEQGTSRGKVTSREPARLEWPEQGALETDWQALNLALLSPMLPETELSGRTSGALRATWEADQDLDLAGQIRLSGAVARDEIRLEFPRAEADLNWNDEGLRGEWSLSLGEKGRLSGEIASEGTARLEVPEQGRLKARWTGIDLALLRPWLPPDLLLEGQLGGQLEGEWFSGERLAVTGRSDITQGDLAWEGEEGIISAALERAHLSWTWEDETLRGDLNLSLADYGRAEGRFALPLPARFPTEIEPEGPIRGELTARLQEQGLLNALLPGVVQESRGELDLDLRVSGTWEAPDLGGEVRLAEASAFLPTTGIRVEDVQLQARLSEQEIRLTSVQVRSGKGRLGAQGVIRLEQWSVSGYQLQIQGEDFQAVNLPELEMLVSPDLQVEGTLETLAVRGEVLIPEMFIRGRGDPAPVQRSPDVVVVDAEEEEPRRESPLDLDIRVTIRLGDHVLIKAEGIDARLEGSLRLAVTGTETDQITAQGEIRVAQGKYAAYGISLDITRGSILFAGGPVDRPILDIVATRTVGDVEAGVKVSGTPRTPQVDLYSEPHMPDTDILAYIVLGRPMGQGGEGDAGVLMFAANALLSKGESAMLQDRLKRELGIDVLEIEAGDGQGGGSQITIGKYLSPDLYISYGKSLFSDLQEARLRYSLGRHWQLESSIGTESAVDLYYQVEFR